MLRVKKPLYPLVCCVLLFCGLSPLGSAADLVFGPGPEAPGNALDAIVAVVDDDVITRRELNEGVAAAERQLRQRKAAIPPTPVLEQQVLERLILMRLQVRAAERNGITVDDATLNAAIDTLAQRNNLSLTQLRQTVEKDGISFARFRDDVRREIMSARLRQKLVDSQLRVSEQDVESLQTQLASGQTGFNAPAATADADPQPDSRSEGDVGREYHIAQILVALPEDAAPEQVEAIRRKAEAILVQVREGADFARLAASESAGQQATEGGDLGWRSAEALPTIFAPVVPTLQPGQVSSLIRSPSGFHIVKLLEVRGGRQAVAAAPTAKPPPPAAPTAPATPEAERDRAREALLRRRSDEEWDLLLRRLRSEAYIETRLGPNAAVSAEPPAPPTR